MNELQKEKIKTITKNIRKKELPPSKFYIDTNFEFTSLKNRRLYKYHLVKQNNSDNYLFLIKRVGNYYTDNLKDINIEYNIWDTPETFNNIKKCIKDIKKKYGNEINLKIYHLCVPIKINEDCVYYFKELKDIHSELTIKYIENNNYKHKGNMHNGDFSTFEVYGSYSWEYINNL